MSNTGMERCLMEVERSGEEERGKEEGKGGVGTETMIRL